MNHITWQIKGYAGHDDYDGPNDYNFKHIFQTSDNLTESDIEAVIQNRYRNKQVLVYKIERKENEQN